MNNEKLIKLVKGYTFLYDLCDKRYSDSQKKDDAWKEIGIKLNQSGQECKKAWALLRDGFRRAAKKNIETKGAHASDRKWKFQDEMSFLLPYMKERAAIFNVASTSHTTTDVSVMEEIMCDKNSSEELLMAQSDVETPPLKMPDVTVSTSYPRKKRQKRICRTSTAESPSAILMKYILDNRKMDDIGQFFAGIATTVRSFPMKERAIAKSKVFQVVSEMEIEIINRQSTVSTASSLFTSYSSNHTPTSTNLRSFSQTPTSVSNF